MAEYATRDYTVVSGDDWADDIIITDTNSEPVDITDYDVEFSLESKLGEVELVIGDGVAIDPVAGKIAVSLTPEQTAGLPLGRLTKFQLRLINPAGVLTTRLMGFFIVIKAVIDA